MGIFRFIIEKIFNKNLFGIYIILYIYNNILGYWGIVLFYHIRAGADFISGFIGIPTYVFIITMLFFIFLYKKRGLILNL